MHASDASPRSGIRTITWIVGLIYALAWFVPVVRDGHKLGEGVLPGWDALLMALSPLWSDFNGTTIQAILIVSSGLTNLLFVIAFLRLALRSKPSSALWVWLIFASTAINAYWMAYDVRDLRAGYWLWLTSFVLLATVAHFRRATQPSAA